MRIRQVHYSDWELARSVRLRALEESPGAFNESLAVMRTAPEAMWRERTRANAEAKTSVCFLAFGGDRAIGMAAGLLAPAPADAACVVALWVDPDYRRDGLASELVHSVRQWAQTVGAGHLYAHVRAGNFPARDFFSSIGFDIVQHPEETPFGSEDGWTLHCPIDLLP